MNPIFICPFPGCRKQYRSRQSLEIHWAAASGHPRYKRALYKAERDIRPAYRRSARDIRALRTTLQRFENELVSASALDPQIAMDRQSKFVSTLSNLMKKMSNTSASIIQNLK